MFNLPRQAFGCSRRRHSLSPAVRRALLVHPRTSVEVNPSTVHQRSPYEQPPIHINLLFQLWPPYIGSSVLS